MRKADFITTENCNKEVDRLREQLAAYTNICDEKQAELSRLTAENERLQAQLKAQG